MGRMSGAIAALCAVVAGCEAAPPREAPMFDWGTGQQQSPDADRTPPPPDDAGVADAAPPPADAAVDSSDLDAPGPYRVGYRELRVSYVTHGGGQRDLRVAVWYPTEDAAGGDAATYFDGALVRDGVIRDARPAGRDALPVLLFSHGNNGIAEQSFFLTERFASHGWLVAAPDHAGDTFESQGTFSADLLYQRPQDMAVVLDALQTRPADDPLAGRAGERVVVAGHSLGGYTALALAGAGFDMSTAVLLCADAAPGDGLCGVVNDPAKRAILEAGFHDPRVDAVIPMAPSGDELTILNGLAAIDVPVLLVTAARDGTLPDERFGTPIWQGLDGAYDLRVDFTNAGHFTFANVCDELDGFAEVVGGDGCGPDFLPPAQAHAAVNVYALAFARRHAEFDMSVEPILTGAEPVHSDVRLFRHQ